MQYEIVSIRDNPDYLEAMVDYYSSRWKLNKQIWHDVISDCITTKNSLPRWYLMKDSENVVGCVGLMADGLAKDDFKPYLAGLYVEENMRRKNLGGLLLNHILSEAIHLGLSKIHLTTYHTGYFEKYGWVYCGDEEINSENKVRAYVINLTDNEQ